MSLDELKRQLERAQRDTPTYLDTLPETEPEKLQPGSEEGDQKAVLMVHPQPIDLTLSQNKEAVAPEGIQGLDVYRRSREGKKIGQILVGSKGVGEEEVREIREALTAPNTRIGIVVREEEPGLVGRMMALVRFEDMPEDFPRPQAGQKGDQQPWQESIPDTPDFGSEWSPPQETEGDNPPFAGGGPGGKPADPEDRRVGLPLGAVVRYQQDRAFPDDFMREAKDLFKHGLAGGLPPVRDRVIEELRQDELDDHNNPESPGRSR